ncbi:MAG: PAS domain S-box protein [Campylobacterales bacterium]
MAIKKGMSDIVNSPLFEKGPVVIIVWRNETGWPVEAASPNITNLLGYTSEDFISGKLVYADLIHPDDLRRVAEEVQVASLNNLTTFTHRPYRFRHAHGSWRWLHDSTVVIHNDQGEITHYIGYLIDITHQHELEEERSLWQQRFEMAWDGANDGLWDWDIASGKVYFSTRWKEIIGYSADEFPDDPNVFFDAIHPEDRSKIEEALQRHFADPKQPYHVEFRMKCKDGHYKWLLTRGKVWLSPEGKPLRMAGSHTDISEQKELEEQLRLNNRFLDSVLNSLDALVYVIDLASYKVLYVNEYARNYFHDASGELCYRFFQGRDTPCPFCPITQEERLHNLTATPHTIQWKNRSPINNRWYAFNTRIMPWIDGRVVQIQVGIDITEEYEAQKALEEEISLRRALLDNSAVGIFLASPNRTIKRANQRAAQMFGYTIEEMEGQSFRLIHISDEKFEEFALQYDKLLDHTLTNIEYPLKRKDGNILWCSVSGTALDPTDLSKGIIWTLQDITERKISEEKIRTNEEMLQAIYEVLPVGISITDPEGRIIDCNRASEQILGITKEDHLQLNITNKGQKWQIIRPDGTPMPPTECPGIRALKEGDPVFDVEMGIIKSDTTTWMSVSAMPVANDRFGVVIVYVDITAQKEILDALRLAQERYKTIFTQSSDGLALFDPISQKPVDFNRVFYEQLGYTAEEAKDLTIRQIDATQEIDEIQRHIKTIQERGWDTYEAVHRTKNGELRDVLVTVQTITIDNRPLMFTTFRDITEQKRAREALAESEMRWKFAVEGSGDGLWDWNITDNSVFFSRRWKEMLGYSEEEISGSLEEWAKRIHPEDKERVYADLNAYLDSRTTIYQNEHRVLCKDGSYKWVLDRGMIVARDSSGKPTRMIGTHTDINNRKEAERLIIEAKEAAERANRAKSEFLANISHEIRTPLNAILGFSDLLAQEITDPRYQSYLEGIRVGGKNLLRLINDILDLSKIEAGRMELKLEPVNLTQLAEEMRTLFYQKAEEKRVKLLISLSSTLPKDLLLDEIRIRQILINLLGNALKFTDAGEVELSIDAQPSRDDHTTFDLTFSVRDTGIGIDPGQRERIFETFVQADGQSTRRYGGTGLGLTITKRLTEMMGGQITLESTPGQGSIFRVHLKATQCATIPIEDKQKQQKISSEPTTTITPHNTNDNYHIIQSIVKNGSLATAYSQEAWEALGEMWYKVNELRSNDDIAAFAREIAAFASTKGDSELLAYASSLEQAAERFDLTSMEKLFDLFAQKEA